MSAYEVHKVREIAEKHIGPLFKHKSRRNWYTTIDLGTSIYFTFSKYYELQRVWWYGFVSKDIEAMLEFRKAYIILIMGNHKNTLVIPAKIIKLILNNVRRKRDGNYTMHLVKDGYAFKEAPSYDLRTYKNMYDQMK